MSLNLNSVMRMQRQILRKNFNIVVIYPIVCMYLLLKNYEFEFSYKNANIMLNVLRKSFNIVAVLIDSRINLSNCVYVYYVKKSYINFN